MSVANHGLCVGINTEDARDFVWEQKSISDTEWEKMSVSVGSLNKSFSGENPLLQKLLPFSACHALFSCIDNLWGRMFHLPA